MKTVVISSAFHYPHVERRTVRHATRRFSEIKIELAVDDKIFEMPRAASPQFRREARSVNDEHVNYLRNETEVSATPVR